MDTLDDLLAILEQIQQARREGLADFGGMMFRERRPIVDIDTRGRT